LTVWEVQLVTMSDQLQLLRVGWIVEEIFHWQPEISEPMLQMKMLVAYCIKSNDLQLL
jgi:hypothetical protein